MTSRAEILAPLYGAAGPIVVELTENAELYRRGECEIPSPKPADTWLMEYASCLVRWEAWLRKARVGTLRWLASQTGTLAAGRVRATTAVRSQLANAGLMVDSEFWGDATGDDCRTLALWARCELDRRGK